MGFYDYEIRQALREIAQELKTMRREVEAMRRENKIIRERLTTTGGLTAATTRRAHLIVDGDKREFLCSACGCVYRNWYDDASLAMVGEHVGRCRGCGAILRGDPEFVSGSGNE